MSALYAQHPMRNASVRNDFANNFRELSFMAITTDEYILLLVSGTNIDEGLVLAEVFAARAARVCRLRQTVSQSRRRKASVSKDEEEEAEPFYYSSRLISLPLADY